MCNTSLAPSNSRDLHLPSPHMVLCSEKLPEMISNMPLCTTLALLPAIAVISTYLVPTWCCAVRSSRSSWVDFRWASSDPSSLNNSSFSRSWCRCASTATSLVSLLSVASLACSLALSFCWSSSHCLANVSRCSLSWWHSSST